MNRLLRPIAALTALSFTLAATPALAADPVPSEGSEPEGSTSALTLETPSLQFSDKGQGMDAKKMISIGVLLTATGAASLIGSSLFVMSCPENNAVSPVDQREIKCFDKPGEEIDPVNPENPVEVPAGPGYYTLPAMIGLGVAGGVLLVTGATLIALGVKKKKARGLSAAPSFGPSGAGMVLTGRF